MKYHSYTLEHIVTQLQLLIFSALAFTVLMKTGLYPPELRSTNLDSDWFYRKPVKWIAGGVHGVVLSTLAGTTGNFSKAVARLAEKLYMEHGPTGHLARTRPSGSMALYMAVLRVAFMAFSFF